MTYLVAFITGEGVSFAGNVQNTSFVPAEKSTALSLLLDDKIVLRVNVDELPFSVPLPTSNSLRDL